jgi:cell division protein FtsW (lipid II flippase)
MAGWVLWLSVVTILSYLADAGVLPALRDIRIPMLNASVTSVLLLVSTMGLVYRVQGKRKSGERERLTARVQELERELASKT